MIDFEIYIQQASSARLAVAPDIVDGLSGSLSRRWNPP